MKFNKMRTASLLMAIILIFAVSGAIAQHNNHHSQAQTQDQSTPGMMGGGMMGMIGQMNQMNHMMGRMMTQHQQMSDMMTKLMQNMRAMQNEKGPAKLQTMMKDQQMMLDQMHTHMMHEGEMMHQMMGTKTEPESTK
jgi:hypothetical protein